MPVVQQVESKLLKLFKAENHFEKYGVLKSAPDVFLKELWNKCILPNGEMFYYAKNWLDSLEAKPRFWKGGPSLNPPPSEDDIKNYARAADSTIKRDWVSTPIPTGETATGFIQFLFEREWITEMARGAVYSTKGKENLPRWTVNNFRDMVEKVVQFLNVFGYSLEAPHVSRLEKLWSLVSKGDLYRSTEW
jgi:hypothetical protein